MAAQARKHYAPGDSPADRARRNALYRERFYQERSKDPYWRFYSTVEWRKLRTLFLRANPICASCGGRATQADHIQTVRENWSRRLDQTNLQPLCASCHSSKTLRTQNAKR